jgi:beta-glucosidase
VASGGVACTRLDSSDAPTTMNGDDGGGGGGGGSEGGTVTGSNGGDSGSSATVVNPDADITVQKMACGASTTTDPFSPGYGDLTTVTSEATSAVLPLTETQQANLMRGTPSGCGGATQNYTDDFENGATTGNPMVDGTGPIRQIFFRDGPRGVCMVPYSTAPKAMNEFPQGDYATTFPTSSARGAAFDLALEEQIGEAIGNEMVAVGSTLLLAPVINILRHPAWGRSQETYGEDSFLLGRLGTAFVDGAQQYIPACVKHFAAYNIENGRESGNLSVLDEQTAYESYGRHFEMVIQDAGVACVMAAYNEIQIGGGTAGAAHCTSNSDLLTTMLRTTFGFKGFVMSDFWAMPNGQTCPTAGAEGPVASTAAMAGLDLEMPWSLNYSQLEADGLTSEITTSAERIVTQQYRFGVALPGAQGLQATTSTFTSSDYSVSNPSHVQLAYQAALESMVLLKNANSTLPIPSTVKTIAVIGANVPYMLSTSADVQTGTIAFATDVRTGDLGSSRVYTDPTTSTSPFAGIQTAAQAKGMTVVTGTTAATTADFYVVVAGMTPEDEGEEYTSADGSGGDRLNFELDGKAATPIQDPLIEAVAALGKPMVVVLEGGSVISMPWLSSVPAVVMAWYPGQDGGHALADLLLGNANFSGKLPVTWPNAFTDEPVFSAANKMTTMGYYVGYKYFDQNAITPLFPFGYGLSYTTFTYSNLLVPCSTVATDSVVDVQVEVTNSGTVDGDEVSMLFVSYPNTTQRRPKKELKAFTRTTIKAGQTELVTIPLRVEDLKYWNATSHSWQWENGAVQIQVGGSSGNLLLTDSITVMN